MLIGMIKHRGIGRLQSNQKLFFIRAGCIPGFDTRVVRRQRRTGRHDTHLDLAREAPFALNIPAVGESLVITANEIGGRLMRRMTDPVVGALPQVSVFLPLITCPSGPLFAICRRW